MIKRFLELEWKRFFRSSNWQKSVAINILLVFIALYFIGLFTALGFFAYQLLQEYYPESDPFVVFNSFLFYWIIIDLLMRFFFQKLPVMSVKPLLTLPVKRKKVVHYVLRKSALSFFNILPFFAVIPFCFRLLNEGYPTSDIVTWLVMFLILTLTINFLNFIIESISAETELSFLPIILVSGSLFALNYFNVVSFSDLVSKAILSVIENPVLIFILLLLLCALYYYNFRILKKKLYIDNSLKTKTREAKTTNLTWTKKFGDIAPFMQLDLKLISRNKRARSSAFIIVIGLFYGLFFYPQDIYLEFESIYVLVGVFATGVFLISYGQFIPAWDGDYYKLLMSQNIKYEKYLKSKYTLMISSVIIMFVFNIPYVYFGWKILIVHFAAAIYNIGVNSYVIMYAGSFNRKKIKLDQRAAFNYQGTGVVQWLITLPIMFVPMILFMIVYYAINFEAAVIFIAGLGVLGIAFHQRMMRFITNKYLDSKYKMIDAFDQEQ